jgi:outer membrane protein assembly factor BamB/actin-like ATPase involved in cell morphogenesis
MVGRSYGTWRLVIPSSPMTETGGAPPPTRATSVPAGFVLSVDLGTSHTVAVLRGPDGRTRALLFDGQPLLPSAVFLDDSGLLQVGRDALRLARVDPSRLEPSPKRRIDEGTVLLGGAEIEVVDLLAAVLARVAAAAVEAAGHLPPAVLTHPAAWGPPRRSLLIEAATRAGWPRPRLVPEPVAAARYFAEVLRRPVPVGSAVAVFDFGGGTLDVAVVRNTGSGFAVIAVGGADDLGGLDLDAALVDHLGDTLGRSAPDSWERLHNPRSARDRRDRRFFWEDVRGSKEMLSRTTLTPVPVPGSDTAIHVTRDELEQVVRPLLTRAVAAAREVLRNADVPPDRMAGLFLVGGSSRVPMVARMLHSELGVAPTVLEQPEIPVAEGALAELPVPTRSYLPPGLARATSARNPDGTEPFGSQLPPPPGTAPVYPPPPGTAPVYPPPSGTAPLPTAPLPTAPLPTAPLPTAPPPVPGRSGLRRYGRWLAAVAAGLVVVVGITVAVVALSRRQQTVNFASELTAVGSPVSALTSGASGQAVEAQALDGGAYLASVDSDSHRLELVALGLTDGKQRWRATTDGAADSWLGIRATPDVVLAFEARTSGAGSVYAFDRATGAALWRRTIAYDANPVYAGGSLVGIRPAGQGGQELVAYDLRTGDPRWTVPLSGTGNAVYPVHATSGLFEPSPTGDAEVAVSTMADRVVVVTGDSTVQVLDVAKKSAGARRGNVATGSYKLWAQDDLLYVATSSSGYRIDRYDMDSMSSPHSVYTTSDPASSLTTMIGCGAKRLCLIERTGDDSQVIRVDKADSDGQPTGWTAPKAERLLPIGDWLLVSSATSEPQLIDADGKQVFTAETQNARVVRLDDRTAVAMTFNGSGLSAKVGLTGLELRSGKAVRAPEVAADGMQCAWTTSRLACPTIIAGGDKEVLGYGVWTFTK